MRPLIASLSIVCAVAWSIGTAASSPGIPEPVWAGEVIGGASACGVPQARIRAVERSVVRRLRAQARSRAEARHAHLFYEEAVRRGAERIRAGEGDCGEALHSFRVLEARQRRRRG